MQLSEELFQYINESYSYQQEIFFFVNANNSENNPSTSLYEFIIYILSSIDMHSGMIENDEELIMSLVPSHFRLVIIMITTND
ncbi:unnamed protein product [Rotaria sordida]|uniref:Uncharacterized protein n=1 Tax=Rotaria sordida TaxID=392033 RepID=A0A820EBQ8_9BILA|nr:unnamed protein product [Rotaria sordida]CAF1600096.1 unnamed protein product [Rotaria sordida]CAF4244487.1 unnamed protein product [Rotaria sordida]